jgi:transglutaminase-like putative cysteine protease
MHFMITHRTEYIYERYVHHSIHELRLMPSKSSNQTVQNWKILAPNKLNESMDAFGNYCHTFVMDNHYMNLIIEAKGEVMTTDQFLFEDPKDAVSPYYLLQSTDLTQISPEMLQYFEKLNTSKAWTPERLLKLAKEIRKTIVYGTGVTDIETSAAQAFELKKGVCQDHSHIMLSLCRSFGLPARYVSGYFYEENDSDLSSHAWVDVCLNIDAAVWHSVDITNACFSDKRHIRLAVGRDYAHVAPVKGIRSGGGDEELITKLAIEKC